jgi:hypothetical protein
MMKRNELDLKRDEWKELVSVVWLESKWWHLGCDEHQTNARGETYECYRAPEGCCRKTT